MNALVGAVTLGQGAMAIKGAGLAGKEAVIEVLKTWAVDAISDTAAYTVGYACDELGLPSGMTFFASLITGYQVSTKAGKYLLTDAAGNVVRECTTEALMLLFAPDILNYGLNLKWYEL